MPRPGSTIITSKTPPPYTTFLLTLGPLDLQTSILRKTSIKSRVSRPRRGRLTVAWEYSLPPKFWPPASAKKAKSERPGADPTQQPLVIRWGRKNGYVFTVNIHKALLAAGLKLKHVSFSEVYLMCRPIWSKASRSMKFGLRAAKSIDRVVGMTCSRAR
jgi:hypothetical protein